VEKGEELSAESLVGMECVRFQGLRVAYFAVDKDSKLGCSDEVEGVAPGRREGDVLVLNRIVSSEGGLGQVHLMLCSIRTCVQYDV
jgi:glutaminyl-tRNA synthetase